MTRHISSIMGQQVLSEPPAPCICDECLGDALLKTIAVGLDPRSRCAACDAPAIRGLQLQRIAKLLETVLPAHFVVGCIYDKYELYLEDIIARAIGCESLQACDAIAKLLVEPDASDEDFFFDGQEYSRESSPFESQEHEESWIVDRWDSIARDLTHGRRFFNEPVREFFQSLIDEALQAKGADSNAGSPVVRTLPPGTSLFRARITADTRDLERFQADPLNALGAAPRERARNNRMSAAGVPLLYTSRDIETCIAEVRPSIGDTVVVGRFITTATLKIFDFYALTVHLQHAPLSLFDPNYQERVQQRLLLQYLHREIARPVKASETDYVVTQALAEFIAHETEKAFDGLAFRSVQRNEGENIVLFIKGDQVEYRYGRGGPLFQVEISPSDVSTHKIGGVTYHLEGEGDSSR